MQTEEFGSSFTFINFSNTSKTVVMDCSDLE